MAIPEIRTSIGHETHPNLRLRLRRRSRKISRTAARHSRSGHAVSPYRKTPVIPHAPKKCMMFPHDPLNAMVARAAKGAVSRNAVIFGDLAIFTVLLSWACWGIFRLLWSLVISGNHSTGRSSGRAGSGEVLPGGTTGALARERRAGCRAGRTRKTSQQAVNTATISATPAMTPYAREAISAALMTMAVAAMPLAALAMT